MGQVAVEGRVPPIARRAVVATGRRWFLWQVLSCRVDLAGNRTCVAPRQQLSPVTRSNHSDE